MIPLWYLRMIPSLRFILYTSKVIKGNVCIFQDRLVLPVLLYYQWALEGWVVSRSQLISYFWCGFKYNMYHCWQIYNSNFMGKADVCELYNWLACFSRASHRCSSNNLLVVFLNMVDLCLRDALSRWRSSQRVFTCPLCMPIIFLTGNINSCMFMINYWSLYYQVAC